MDTHDSEEIYCRMLGHRLTFSYCRTVAGGLPCRRIMDCWFERLPIEDFIRAHYSEKDIETIFSQPEDKMTSLIDLIRQAKERSSSS